MDTINVFLIALIIIFLPGILATVICEKLIIHEKWNNFKFFLYAFALGLLSYSLLQALYYIIQIPNNWRIDDYTWKILKTWNSINSSKPQIHVSELIYAIMASILLSFIVSKASTKNWLYRIAKKIGVSSKYGDENLFYFYLNSKEIYWVYIRDIKNDLTYRGRIMYFSVKDHVQEIVLFDVSVYNYKDSAHLYDIESIYLSKKSGEFIIEEAKK